MFVVDCFVWFVVVVRGRCVLFAVRCVLLVECCLSYVKVIRCMLFVRVVRYLRSVGVASCVSCVVSGLLLLFADVCCVMVAVVCKFGVLILAVCCCSLFTAGCLWCVVCCFLCVVCCVVFVVCCLLVFGVCCLLCVVC